MNLKPVTVAVKSSVPSMGVKVSWNTPRLTTVLPVTEFVEDIPHAMANEDLE
jgi:hypothetical protein